MSHPIDSYVREKYQPAEIAALIRHLEAAGTFAFPHLGNGLYSAAVATSDDYEYTGYSSVWLRDNIHIAHMHMVVGQIDQAVQTVKSLTMFLRTQQAKIDAIVAGDVDPRQVMLRPHVRFNGGTLTELAETWAHAQNDALGYWIWLSSRLAAGGHLKPATEDFQLLAALVKYLQAIRYWTDEDSGHWEEAVKVEASSIGAVVGGLSALKSFLDAQSLWPALQYKSVPILPADLAELIRQGQTSLNTILPSECIQNDTRKRRRYDSALLFLIYPLAILSDDMADRIVDDVVGNLLGPHGIRRYVGDSYWCQDYKTLVSQESRTTDVSEDMSGRDRLLEPGCEAQWCIFDPIISVIHGKRYQETKDPERLRLQTLYLNRSLRQLTSDNTPFPPLRCPESYYRDSGRYIPNDVTPLLWTQANLRLALCFLQKSLSQ